MKPMHNTKLYLAYFEFTESVQRVPAGVETVVAEV